jgi:hypothetical protein
VAVHVGCCSHMSHVGKFAAEATYVRVPAVATNSQVRDAGAISSLMKSRQGPMQARV